MKREELEAAFKQLWENSTEAMQNAFFNDILGVTPSETLEAIIRRYEALGILKGEK